MSEPGWPVDGLAPDEHLIALGAFSLAYNEAEMALWTFFKRYVANAGARDYLFEALHNRGRVDLILAMTAADDSEDYRAAVKWGLDCFDICAENRNIALHAFPDLPGGEDHVALMKRATSKPGEISRYLVPSADIRASAVTCRALMVYFFGLNSWLEARDRAIADSPIAILGLPSLPPKPPKPRKLNLSRRSVVLPDEQPPPEPEQG